MTNFRLFTVQDKKKIKFPMSEDIVDEPLSTSYDFCDAKNVIIVTLYAKGAFEIKDIDISIDTDSLEIHTPGKHQT